MTKSNLFSILKSTALTRHVLFWGIVFIYYASATWQLQKDWVMVTKVAVFEVALQIAIAYFIIHVLIPKLLNVRSNIYFYASIVGLVVFAHVAFSWYVNYVVFTSPQHDSYRYFIKRVTYVFGYFTTFVGYLMPALLLIVFNYLQKQKEMANLLEQKRTSELNALKNQLNPHFLFNTMNNLYVLALKKSDQTPQVIAKLSEILDYILYRCNENFVPLASEMTLLKNYIALEQVRYNERVDMTIHEELEHNAKIAPLLLLTFLENAYKHGVTEELTTAKIEFNIRANQEYIDFQLKNTKPRVVNSENLNDLGIKNREAIGLKNIRKQLDLLYAHQYDLAIENTSETYSVNLKIKWNNV